MTVGPCKNVANYGNCQPAIFHKNINVVNGCKASTQIKCGHNCGHSGTIWSSSPFDTLFRCVVVIIVVKNVFSFHRQYDSLIPPRYCETAYKKYINPFKIIIAEQPITLPRAIGCPGTILKVPYEKTDYGRGLYMLQYQLIILPSKKQMTLFLKYDIIKSNKLTGALNNEKIDHSSDAAKLVYNG